MAAGKKEDKDDKAEQVDEATLETKKKKKKLFMFIGLAVLLVLISVGATFFIVSKMMGSKHSSDSEEASSEASELEETAVTPAIYYPLKPNFTVNYDVNGRQRFLQAELTIMYRDPEVLKTIELHMPAVRNGLVMLLSSQVFEELQTAEGKEKLRAAALQTVQNIIAKEESITADKNKAKEKDDDEDEEKDKDKDKEKPKQKAPNIEQILFTQFVMQ